MAKRAFIRMGGPFLVEATEDAGFSSEGKIYARRFRLLLRSLRRAEQDVEKAKARAKRAKAPFLLLWNQGARAFRILPGGPRYRLERQMDFTVTDPEGLYQRLGEHSPQVVSEVTIKNPTLAQLRLLRAENGDSLAGLRLGIRVGAFRKVTGEEPDAFGRWGEPRIYVTEDK